MTEPDATPDPNAIAAMQAMMQLHFNAHPTPQPGPDGKTWVGIVFAAGNLIAEVRVPDELADAIADAIPKMIHEAAANARRTNLGLILPNGAAKIDLSKLRDPGGHN